MSGSFVSAQFGKMLDMAHLTFGMGAGSGTELVSVSAVASDPARRPR